MLIHRNVIRSLHAATKPDDTRRPLQGIYVDPESGECIATNGHLLLRAAAPANEPGSEYPTRINGAEIDPTAKVSGLLDSAALVEAAKGTPKRSPVSILSHVAVLNQTAFVATDLDRSTTITGCELKGNFPKWRRVLTVPEDANTFTLAADVLAALAKVAKAQGRPKGDVTFHVVEDQGKNGVYFEISQGDSPKIDGVVMPIRT